MYYEIEGTKVRILGSLHLFPAASRDVPSWIIDAFEWCEQIVFESDESAARQSLLKSNEIGDRIPPPLLDRLNKIWPQNGALPPLSALKPCGVFLILPMLFIESSPGVENVLHSCAVAQGKEIFNLENAADLNTIFNAIPDSIYIEHIQFTLENADAVRASFLEIYSAWLTRSVASILSAASKAPLWNSPLRAPLIGERNRMWAARIASIQPSRRTLIVVGALHLAGGDSLLEQLIARGLTTVQIAN